MSKTIYRAIIAITFGVTSALAYEYFQGMHQPLLAWIAGFTIFFIGMTL